MTLRAPSSELEINHGINPKVLAQKPFKNNTSHSSGFRAGFTTYETGYQAPPGTVWENIKAYKNNEAGLFQHGTTNIEFRGGKFTWFDDVYYRSLLVVKFMHSNTGHCVLHASHVIF
jgi:hypothetical protein